MTRPAYLKGGAALAAILALGACNKSGPGVAMEQGEWETTVQITNASLDNLPPEIRQQMGQVPLNQPQTTRGCMAVTADVVRIQNLRFTVPEPSARGAGCEVAELSMEGGRLTGRMSCTGIPFGPMSMGGGQTMNVSGEMNGTYTPNSAEATGRGELRIGDRSGSVEVRFTSRRLGACPAPRPYTPPPPPPPMMLPESDMNAMAPATNDVMVPMPDSNVSGM